LTVARWLLSVGKYDQAKKVIRRYASSKGKELDETMWNELLAKTETKVKTFLKKKLFKNTFAA